MIEQVEMNDIAKETIEILKYFDPKFVSKIPIKILNTLEQLASSSNKKVMINKSKKLKEQIILEETKDFIAFLYYDYLATEVEKKEILKIWKKNEIIYQESIRQKYSYDAIFKKNHEISIHPNNSNLPIVMEKENWIKKIGNWIKKLLKK